MSTELTVLIASAARIPDMRKDAPIAGSVLYFSDSNLAAALESIRATEPKMVALESQFVESGQGKAFVHRLLTLELSASAIRRLARVDGDWSTLPLADNREAARPAAVVNTRRCPRFQVLGPLPGLLDGNSTSFIDLSILGAQVVSAPVLRPKQRIKIIVADSEHGDLKFAAYVAWSHFEKPKEAPAPHYRAGVAFDAEHQELEEFRRRYCADTPLEFRP
jgi:hypothetical protein